MSREYCRDALVWAKMFVLTFHSVFLGTYQLRPEGRNRRGETQLRGPELLGPLRGLGIRPLVSVIRGLGDPFPEAPNEEVQKSSQGLKGGSSEASERGVRFQRIRKTRWATQRPLRGPVFPDAP